MRCCTIRLAIILSGSILFLLTMPGCTISDKSVPEIVKQTKGAVGSITTYDDRDSVIAQGTGFFVSPNEVVTNKHVLSRAARAEVRLVNGRTYVVTYVVGIHQKADLIKIGVDTRDDPTQYLEVRDDLPQDGSSVVVVGNPLGLSVTVSEGIISAARDLVPYGKVLQITAPISPGSSGSPVVDLRGRVIGIATLQYTQGQNLNFALPTSRLREMHIFSHDSLMTLAEWRVQSLKEWFSRPTSEKIRAGHIKSVVIWKVHVVGGKPNGNPEKVGESYFDELGRILRDDRYHDFGGFIYTAAFEYDTSGNVVGEGYKYGGVGSWITNTRKYDSGGRLQSESNTSLNKRTDFSYSGPNKTWKEYALDGGALIEEGQTEYNSQGLPTVTRSRLSRTGERFATTFDYDVHGNEIHQVTESVDTLGRRTWISETKHQYRYSKAGDKVEETRWESNVRQGINHEIESSEYDLYGRIVKHRREYNGLAWTQTYTYDEKGNIAILLEKNAEAPGTTHHPDVWRYTYDEHGNITQRIKILSGVDFNSPKWRQEFEDPFVYSLFQYKYEYFNR